VDIKRWKREKAYDIPGGVPGGVLGGVLEEKKAHRTVVVRDGSCVRRQGLRIYMHIYI